MKALIIFTTAVLFASTTLAQKPERILGNARVQKPISYYKQQSAAWKKVTEQEPKNGDAWYNYFYANRVLFFNDTTDKRPDDVKEAFMQGIVSDIGKQLPDSYEYNLCKFVVGGNDPKLVPYLKKAASLGEGHTEHLDYMINIAEMERNTADRDLYCKKKFEAGLFSSGMMYYNYNVMMGLEQNAILITCGDNDTYPVWALQAQGIRKDITVINTSLIRIDGYRQRIFKELGLEDKEAFLQKNTNEDSAGKKFDCEIIRYITDNKKKYPVYVGLTAASCRPYVEKIEDDLYLTGLTYQYSKIPLDNMAVMRHNFEQSYALDYIDKPFYQDIAPGMVGIINTNYIIPMLKLYEHYKLSGDQQKEEWIKNKLLAVCKGTENEDEVKKRIALK
jgi:hypothetical protein